VDGAISACVVNFYDYFFHITLCSELSFLFCSAKKETKKAVENQLLRWFSMARAPVASNVGIYRTNMRELITRIFFSSACNRNKTATGTFGSDGFTTSYFLIFRNFKLRHF